MSDVVTVEVPAAVEVVEVEVPTAVTVVTVATGMPGVPGRDGADGETFSFEYEQVSPLATWTIPVDPLWGRRPNVAIYSSAGEMVIADITASSTSVTVTFASPVAGFAVLS